MNAESITLLNWARGTGFNIALAIFVFGTIYRVISIIALRRKTNYAEARASGTVAGAKAIFTRFSPAPGMLKQDPIVHVAGITFHLGYFVILFGYAPHIEALKTILHFSWPALPTGAITAITVLTMIAMITLLVHRVTNPVRRFLSDAQDYWIWIVSFLPVITGYLAFQHALLPYTQMLAYHILSVELLLVLLPFTRLSHFISTFFARFYAGSDMGRKGVAS